VRRHRERAIHNGMKVAMIHEGKMTPPVEIGCELMGSAEACKFSTGAFSAVNRQLDAAGRGYRLPPSDQFDLSAMSASHICECDDITVFAGGFGKECVRAVTWW
jgi:hypothetical protein